MAALESQRPRIIEGGVVYYKTTYDQIARVDIQGLKENIGKLSFCWSKLWLDVLPHSQQAISAGVSERPCKSITIHIERTASYSLRLDISIQGWEPNEITSESIDTFSFYELIALSFDYWFDVHLFNIELEVIEMWGRKVGFLVNECNLDLMIAQMLRDAATQCPTKLGFQVTSRKDKMIQEGKLRWL
ncbi:hypothetical protein M433DRAFT_138277 [Acidomyces richmondensis BFW]|nr:hypothetical protein M433DRAFT_138277 [Acidomyces richmondensis BFW]